MDRALEELGFERQTAIVNNIDTTPLAGALREQRFKPQQNQV
jgi:hypothetical protein